MGAIVKEYLILITLAALAIIGLIWYTRRNVTDIAAGVKNVAKKYGDDFATVTSPSNYFDAIKGIFKKPVYITQAEQRAAIAKINEKLFKK